jgi:hypothetical protein
VLYLLLEGLGTKFFEMIPDQLLPIYRQLKVVADKEVDLIASTHAYATLELLSDIIAESLTPQEIITPFHII